MILGLDQEESLDPARVGAKAAWLARGRKAGLPILQGLVVEAGDSRHHMSIGERALATRGSGGARLAIMKEPLAEADELVEASFPFGPRLVARSSTQLEESGEWAGAFSSYLDLTPPDLPRAVVGCWASAFTVAALERQRAAGISAGGVPMAVLVQPELSPESGGSAQLIGNEIIVHGVLGSPAPLLQGHAVGETAKWDSGWSGDGLIDWVGIRALDEIRALLTRANQDVEASRCEWARADGIWILQLGNSSPRNKPQRPSCV